MVTLKLTTVGAATGLILPEEMLTRLKLSRGDELLAVETPHGYLLTPYNPEVAADLRLGLEFMSDYRETFRALAK